MITPTPALSPLDHAIRNMRNSSSKHFLQERTLLVIVTLAAVFFIFLVTRAQGSTKAEKEFFDDCPKHLMNSCIETCATSFVECIKSCGEKFPKPHETCLRIWDGMVSVSRVLNCV